MRKKNNAFVDEGGHAVNLHWLPGPTALADLLREARLAFQEHPPVRAQAAQKGTHPGQRHHDPARADGFQRR